MVVSALALLGGCDKLLGIQDRELAIDARGSDDLPPARLRISGMLPKLGQLPPGLLPPVTVEVIDPEDNVIRDATAPIFLKLVSDDPAIKMTGTLSKTPSDGVATFTDLSLNRAGGVLRIEVSSTDAPKAVSDPFAISTPEVLQQFRGSIPMANPMIDVGFYQDVTPADLDGDGDLDLVAGGRGAKDHVVIALNNGDGTFGALKAFVTSQNPSELAVADVNSDGKVDVAVTGQDVDVVDILLGDGAGEITAALSLPVCDQPIGVALTDFTGDGRPELAVACSGASFITVFRNASPAGGAPVFEARQDLTTGVGGCTVNVTSADLNRDGLPDLITPTFCSQVAVNLRKLDGTFGAAQTFPLAGHDRGFDVVDLDGDGDLDVVGGAGFDNRPGNPITFLINKTAAGAPSLSFAAPVDLTTDVPMGGEHQLAAVDVDNDGAPDIVSAFTGSSDLLVFHNNGGATASFASHQNIPLGRSGIWMDRGDLDRDGKDDVLLALGSGLLVLYTKH